MKTVLKNSAANAPAILRNTKWRRFCDAAPAGLLAGFLFPTHSALACIREEGGFDFPIFLAFSAMMLFTIAMFALLSWAIKKIFFQKFSWFPMVLGLSFFWALGLGAFGTFAIPEYEAVYASLGADFPHGTQILFSLRQLLWLPFILILGLYHSTRDNPNKTRYFAAALLIEAGLSIMTSSLLSESIWKTVVA